MRGFDPRPGNSGLVLVPFGYISALFTNAPAPSSRVRKRVQEDVNTAATPGRCRQGSDGMHGRLDPNCAFATSATAEKRRRRRTSARCVTALCTRIGPTGKSPKTCPALRAKIFCFRSHANQSHNSACLTADEGRWPSSRTCGEMRWTRELRLTCAAEAYGEVVWFGRRGAGAKFARSEASRGRRRQKSRSPGRARSKP